MNQKIFWVGVLITLDIAALVAQSLFACDTKLSSDVPVFLQHL